MSMMNSAVTWLRVNFRWSNSRQSWEERISVLALAAAALLIAWNRGRLSLSQEVLCWGLLLLVGAILLRRGLLKLFGPVLFYDMVTAARRSRYVWMRCAYTGLILFILLVTYLNTRSFRHNERLAEARLAENFFESFMLVQLVMVTLLTPAYVAGSISDEKERKTLEFLLATDLRNREIVLSKVLSRLANLTLFVLTGLPILGMLQFLGGVDPNLVLAGFAATGLTMLGLAGISILNSTMFKRARDAIAMTYLMTIAYIGLATVLWAGVLSSWSVMAQPVWFGATPPTVGDVVKWFNSGNLLYVIIEIMRGTFSRGMGGGGATIDQIIPALLGGYAWFHGLVAGICITWSILRLRAIALKQMYGKARRLVPGKNALLYVLGIGALVLAAMFFLLGTVAVLDEVRTFLWIGLFFFLGLLFLFLGIWFLLSARWHRPSVGNLPMLWKEVFVEGGLRFNWLAALIVAVLVALSFFPAVLILWFYVVEPQNPNAMRFFTLSREMNTWVRFVGTIVACLTLLGVAVRASTAISGERDRQTFDALLTSPMDSNTMLWSKWLGSIMSIRMGWIWLVLIWALAVATGGMHIFALPLVLTAWFVFAAFVAMLGLWYSMVSKSSMRATVWTLLTMLGLGVGHWLPWLCCTPFLFMGPDHRGVEYLAKFQAGFTPPFVLGLLQFSGEEFLQDWNNKEMIEFFAFTLFGLFAWAVATMVFWLVIVAPKFRALTGRQDREPEWHGGYRSRWQEGPEGPVLARVLTPESSRTEGAILLEETWDEDRNDKIRE
jgi:ABC-type transport system involved in multi-copper enzyme maturation permease subunit